MSIKSTGAATPGSTFVPALKPPPGVHSDPENPESLAYVTHITVGICAFMVTSFFFIRSYVRIFFKKTWDTEDWLCFISWAGTIGYFGLLVSTMHHHGGQHLWDIDAEEAKQVAYWFWVSSIEYGFTIGITKTAVLWLYRRVFSGRKGSLFDIEAIVLIVVMLAFYLATTLVKIFQCIPHGKILDKSMPGTCVNVGALLNTSGSFNTITDFLILLMPAQALWGLRMDFKRKVLIMLVFTFGLCAPVFSAIGFAVRIRLDGNPDSSWNQPTILIWAAAELTTGNLCVCFPEFGVFFKRETYRRRTGPTTSVLNSAKAAIQGRRSKGFSKGPPSDVIELRPRAGPYESLDDDTVQDRRHVPRISAAPGFDNERHIPANSVRVDFEVSVESEDVRK